MLQSTPSLRFSFWWNHTREVQRTLRGGGSVRRSGALNLGVQSPGGFARGGTVFRGLQPSEARLRRAKRGSAERSEAPPNEARLRRTKRGSAERSEAVPPSEARPEKRGSTEAPPSEARPREDHREVAITKKLKKVPPESPGEPLIRYTIYFSNTI